MVRMMGRSAIVASVPERNCAASTEKCPARVRPVADPQLKKSLALPPAIDRILGSAKDREFQKQKTHLIGEIVGRSTTQVKLRPAGLVALQWGQVGERGLRGWHKRK